MGEQIDQIFVVKRADRLELLFFCPVCESVNELTIPHSLASLTCRNCGLVTLDARSSRVEVIFDNVQPKFDLPPN